jgi:hypothetical protein
LNVNIVDRTEAVKSIKILENAKCDRESLINEAQKKATDIIAKANSSEVVQQSKIILEKAKRDGESLIDEAQKEAIDIIAKANSNEAVLQSKRILQKAECDSKLLSTVAQAKRAKMDKDWEEEKKCIARTHHFENDEIKLDIGGHCFTTTLTTLTRFPDTMTGAMFSGRHNLMKNDAGAYFIDRDGRNFHHILNFLRSPETYKMTTDSDLNEELTIEADFYGLGDRMFSVPPFVPAQPTDVKDLQGHTLSLAQDAQGKWFMTCPEQGIPLQAVIYCKHCNIGRFDFRYKEGGTLFYHCLTDFNSEREIFPCQPTPNSYKPCPRCRSIF